MRRLTSPLQPLCDLRMSHALEEREPHNHFLVLAERIQGCANRAVPPRCGDLRFGRARRLRVECRLVRIEIGARAPAQKIDPPVPRDRKQPRGGGRAGLIKCLSSPPHSDQRLLRRLFGLLLRSAGAPHKSTQLQSVTFIENAKRISVALGGNPRQQLFVGQRTAR